LSVDDGAGADAAGIGGGAAAAPVIGAPQTEQ
jgi:hypothetical protein